MRATNVRSLHVVVWTCLFCWSGCTREPAPACPEPCEEFQECVNGVCRDLTCMPPCRMGRVCVRGVCLRECDPSDPDVCGYDETCCSDLRACVDTSIDFYNCSTCGNECPPDRSNLCRAGRCGCDTYSIEPCAEGFGCCDTGCEDLVNDPLNCGACGHSCGELDCVDGECKCSQDDPCPQGEECCPDGCRNLDEDPANCGECGAECEPGEDCCGGDCANTLIDQGHCGECGQSCAEGELCCIGTCSNVMSDPYNCGDCLVDCGVGGECVDGTCR